MREMEKELQYKIECVSEWFKNRIIDKLEYEHTEKGKGDWAVFSSSFLLRRLIEEMGELVETMVSPADTSEKIISECVDVAALAMMIADNIQGE